MKMADRICRMSPDSHYRGTVKSVNGKPVWTGKLNQSPESVLLKPLKRKKPTMYFVNSMSDLFHENVPNKWIDNCFEVMEQTGLRESPHTYQILTKRSKRQMEYMVSNYSGINPPDNIWLGVSAEDQEQANIRLPYLRHTPAAKRFVSLEPQLEEICFSETALEGFPGWSTELEYLDWVIQGCESGPNARGFNLDWARLTRNQCRALGVPYFLKQTIDANGKLDRSQMLDGIKHNAMPKQLARDDLLT